MNIFITSPCPVESAKFLDDKRVNKMVTESVQMLSTVLNTMGGKGVYRTTHANHPSTVWAKTTYANWMWLYEHAIALANEFTARNGKTHLAYTKLIESDMLEQADRLLLKFKQTPFANCAANKEYNLDFRHLPVHEAYKKYLTARWKLDKLAPKKYGELINHIEGK